MQDLVQNMTTCSPISGGEHRSRYGSHRARSAINMVTTVQSGLLMAPTPDRERDTHWSAGPPRSGVGLSLPYRIRAMSNEHAQAIPAIRPLHTGVHLGPVSEGATFCPPCRVCLKCPPHRPCGPPLECAVIQDPSSSKLSSYTRPLSNAPVVKAASSIFNVFPS